MEPDTRYRDGEKPLHEYLRAHARARPEATAYLWYGRALTWRWLDESSDAFAAVLMARGVARGDRVALFMQNCPQYVVAHVAAQKMGAIVVPCGALFRSHELAHLLGDAGARVVVAADDLVPVVESVRAGTAVEHVFSVRYADLLPEAPAIDLPAELCTPAAAAGEGRAAGASPAGGSIGPGGTAGNAPSPAHDMLAAIAHAAADPAMLAAVRERMAQARMDDIALLTYTSGTTGMPKGAMLSLRNALFKSAAAADCNGVAQDDVLLAIAPLYHIAGMVMGINVTLYSGATTVLMLRFDPRAVLQAIAAHRVTWWYSIAPMNVACMQVPDAAAFDLSSLRVNPATSFGITLTEPLADRWRAFTGQAHLFEASYGLSETHTVDTYMPRDAVRWGTQGRPVPGVRVRIVDPDSGAERPIGEAGEIVLASAGNFHGYWNRPDATAATLRDGWVHTGDMGRLDEAGYLTFMGRFKEMIKTSGYSVFPEEVETILIRHPAVAQAAVLGVPDATRGEAVRAFVVRRPGAQLEAGELIAWARENMSVYKAPREVEFRESLPATGAGKVLRRLLRD